MRFASAADRSTSNHAESRTKVLAEPTSGPPVKVIRNIAAPAAALALTSALVPNPMGSVMRSVIVGVVAIWLGATGLAVAEDFRWSGPTSRSSDAGFSIKEADIPRLRAALNLTAEQQPHWAPVEAALVELARLDSKAETLVQRTSAAASKAMQLRRLKTLARPLINRLDDNQKRDAVLFARRMGYSRLVAAF